MLPASIFVLALITLHRVDGVLLHINPAEVVALTAPRRLDAGRVVHPGANCVVYLSDKHYFPVLETCEQVRKLLGAP